MSLSKWADGQLGEESNHQAEEQSDRRVPKFGVLYVHQPGSHYHCSECSMFVPEVEGCTIHVAGPVIRAEGTCGYWVAGAPATGMEPGSHGQLTPEESGYEENEVGFSCKRCVAFHEQGPDRGACLVVSSDGAPDPGNIHPDGCCAAWQPDPERAGWTDDQFE